MATDLDDSCRSLPASADSSLDHHLLELAAGHLAAIVESSEDAIASKTLEGIVTSWNRAAEQLFGYSAAEMIGQSILKIIPPELQHEETELLAKLRAGERISRYETVRVRKDGRRVEVSLTLSPIRDRAGRIVGAGKIAHDITSRKLAEQTLREREAQLLQSVAERNQILESERIARAEAERLSQLKDEFLATLSHELRTPLNAIQGWTTLLRQANVSAEDRARGLQTIERNVRAQAQIVNDLLDMSRIISGKIHLDVQPVLLHEVIRNALDAIRQSAAAKGIRISQELDTGIEPVRVDPNRLQQVLWNLLSNAVKFTPQGGHIRVSLQRLGSHVAIEVADSGVGIRPDFLPQVFDRFRQADASTTRRYGGLGLGLSIVRSLVEMHGGSVRVHSDGQNQGTLFTVDLPISPPNETDPPTPRAPPAPETVMDSIELPRLDDVAVLVVDDTPDGRGLIARILEGRGARATCASSASEALAYLDAGRFDVLLSDIGMPDMDGYQLMRKVRAAEPPGSSPIPAIAVTAYARSEDRQRSLLAGYQMHLSKPIEARELVAGISTLLHLSR
ncbi:MAG TPA: ATP-binding protein [Steroidobacteraceae bacterium]|nr:ATP-binding protein [Steroidobacteraceae bacterium]